MAHGGGQANLIPLFRLFRPSYSTPPLPLQVPQFVAERWHKAGDKPGGEAAAGGGAGQGAPPTPPPPGGGAGAGGVGVVGRVRMAFDPRARPQGGQAATQFMMRLKVSEGAAAELPLEYNLAFTPDHVPMHGKVEQEFDKQLASGVRGRIALEGKVEHKFDMQPPSRIALEGKVEHKFDMQPPSGDRGYRQMLQTREKKWNTPKRKLQMYDPGAAGPRLPMPGTVSNVKRKASTTPAWQQEVKMGTTHLPLPFLTPLSPPIPHSSLQRKASTTPAWQQGAAARAAEKESKRVRMSRDVVEAKLFALFEERPHWTLKHLTDATQQPQVRGGRGRWSRW
ncbi:unnamed protein product [Closterium sp. Naga37s-1]|nr:unnamed protein product [Closterium sp. Naga37s-1]